MSTRRGRSLGLDSPIFKFVDRTRASDSERERVVDRLRAAATAGRLTVDELDERTALAYGAVTRGELAELVDDLPVTREPRPSPRRRALAGSRGFRAGTSSRCAGSLLRAGRRRRPT